MRSRQHGMSLVEVLVAVAIGLIGILIITQAYITGDSFNRSTLGEGGAQTNGTIALFTVERDVRQAGYGIADSRAFACGNIKYYVQPNYSINAGGTLPNVSLAPVSITTTAGQPDQITVMYASVATRLSPTAISAASPAGQFKVDGTYGFNIGDVVLAVNLTGAPNCSLRKVTNVTAGTAQLNYNPGSGGEFNPPPAGNGTLPTYVKDDLVFDLGQVRRRNFAIVNNNLQATDSLLSDGTTSSFDAVDGIVDMRAQYGKDNGVNNGTVNNTSYTLGDGVIDSYDNTPPVTASDWAQVLAVRIGVLARIGNFEKPSVSGGNCDATTVLPTWSGSAASPFNAVDIATVTSEARCFRYRVFETVIPLRNMIWRAS
jgi:type IV pilus assembly protein PilW